MIVLSDLNPATDNVDPFLRWGDSGGIDSGSGDYEWQAAGMLSNMSVSWTVSLDTSDSEIHLIDDHAQSVGNAAVEGFNGIFYLHGPADRTMGPSMSGHYAYKAIYSVVGGGIVSGGRHNSASGGATITLDRVQFLFSSGNIDTGRMSVYGIKHT